MSNRRMFPWLTTRDWKMRKLALAQWVPGRIMDSQGAIRGAGQIRPPRASRMRPPRSRIQRPKTSADGGSAAGCDRRSTASGPSPSPRTSSSPDGYLTSSDRSATRSPDGIAGPSVARPGCPAAVQTGTLRPRPRHTPGLPRSLPSGPRQRMKFP